MMKEIRQIIGVDSIKTLSIASCLGCKEETTIKQIPLIGGPDKGKIKTFYYGCKCEDNKNAREALEARERAKREYAIDLFQTKSLINAKLKKCKFINYQPKNESQKEALNFSLDYAKSFDPRESQNVLFAGNNGLGKSHLAVSIVRHLLNDGYTTIFTSVPKLFTKIKQTFSDEETNEHDLLQALEKVDLLVLDDLGAEQATKWQLAKLFEIIDARTGQPTIYTTNYSLPQLEQQIGVRNYDRLDDLKVITFEGSSHRRKDL